MRVYSTHFFFVDKHMPIITIAGEEELSFKKSVYTHANETKIFVTAKCLVFVNLINKLQKHYGVRDPNPVPLYRFFPTNSTRRILFSTYSFRRYFFKHPLFFAPLIYLFLMLVYYLNIPV